MKKQNNRPTPGIIVKFVRRCHKEQLLAKRRVIRDLSTRHLGMDEDNYIYINQSLTLHGRVLFAKAKEIKRDKGYEYL